MSENLCWNNGLVSENIAGNTDDCISPKLRVSLI